MQNQDLGLPFTITEEIVVDRQRPFYQGPSTQSKVFCKLKLDTKPILLHLLALSTTSSATKVASSNDLLHASDLANWPEVMTIIDE